MLSLGLAGINTKYKQKICLLIYLGLAWALMTMLKFILALLILLRFVFSRLHKK